MHTMPIATVDAVLLTIKDGALKAVVQRRAQDPFKGELALPGGYFHVNEDADADDAVKRVISEKIGIQTVFVEQLFTVSGRDRDPRGWSLSVVFLGLFPDGTLHNGLELVDAKTAPALAFDHNAILEGALARLKGKGAYSTLPASLLNPPFTLAQLQRVYEIVLGTSLETSAFRRKIAALDLLDQVEGQTKTGRGRPGTLWKLREGGQTFDKRSLRPT